MVVKEKCVLGDFVELKDNTVVQADTWLISEKPSSGFSDDEEEDSSDYDKEDSSDDNFEDRLLPPNDPSEIEYQFLKVLQMSFAPCITLSIFAGNFGDKNERIRS